MKLYHYTTFDNFASIWESKILRFSYSKNTNDFFEREKTYVYSQGEFAEKENVWGKIAFDKVMKDVANELDKYRQVSFCRDYGKNMPGYASPMMWGQYARSKDVNGKWQDGVCIELESDMFMKPDNVFYEHKINYPPKVKAPYLHKISFTKEKAAERFVIKYRNLLFFTKHKHWEHEREYRFVSKYECEIGISNAITGIYVLHDDSTLKRIEEIVKDDSLINFLFITGTDDLKLKSINLKEYRELLETMRRHNEGYRDKVLLW
jgi:hypothetical protein